MLWRLFGGIFHNGFNGAIIITINYKPRNKQAEIKKEGKYICFV